jgi:hypothetical protein
MEILKQAETLVSAKLAVIKTLFTMIRLEARLAGLSVFPLLVNICMVFVILMTVWLLTSLLMGYGIFLVAHHNILLSLFLVFLINLGVLLGLIKYLAFNIKNMSFEKTRAYFSQNKSMDDEQFETTVNQANKHAE